MFDKLMRVATILFYLGLTSFFVAILWLAASARSHPGSVLHG